MAVLRSKRDGIGSRRDSKEEHTYFVVQSERKKEMKNAERVVESDDNQARELNRKSNLLLSTSSTPASANSLRRHLTCALQLSMFEKTKHQKFLPRDIFEDILPSSTIDRGGSREDPADTVLKIMEIASNEASSDDRALANHILQNSKNVFLILIRMKHDHLYEAMKLFMDNRFTDDSLPLSAWSGDQLEKDAENHPFSKMESRYRNKSAVDYRIWDVTSIGEFEEAQWIFLAPKLSTKQQNGHFDERCPIPFIDQSTNKRSGAHGIVHKYTIHQAHHEDLLDPVSSEPCVVAVKAFRKGGKHVAADVENEVKALQMMNTLEKDHIVRFLTSFQRGAPDDLEYFLLFEWAHGGNLGDFWKQQAELPRTAELMKWLIGQLRGLAKALTAAHGAVCRHGDLKPANILWFRDATCPYGTLKIGDWGEAKIHKDVTSLRHVDTDAGYGTRRYEPPETGPHSPRQGQGLPKRSRLYDLWGFGCIIFECTIWYLYDMERLNKFNNSNLGTYGTSDFFYERDHVTGIAKVHGVVEHWIEQMSKDSLCRPGETALGDLLQIVRTGLLVVELPKGGGSISQADGGRPQDIKARSTEPTHAQKSLDVYVSHPTIEVTAPEPSKLDDAVETPNAHGITPTFNITEPLVTEPTGLQSPEPKQNVRLRADELEEGLSRILLTQRENRYWDRFQDPRPEPVETDNSSRLLAPSGPHISTATNLRVPPTHKIDYEHPSLDPDDWRFELDNEFAAHLLSFLDTITSTPSPQSSPAPNLCRDCKEFGERLPETNFSMSYTIQVLKRNADAKLCNLCCLLWQIHRKCASTERKEVRFYRVGTTLCMNGAKNPVCTLLRSNGPDSRAHDIQIGLAELPSVGTPQHFGIVRSWLDDCDERHAHTCKPSKISSTESNATTTMPTRLIYVGNDGDDVVQLREMQGKKDVSWIALSYRWGDSSPFSTTQQNLRSHVEGMKLKALPRTFQDAIKVTRALGRSYLWIDSLCIVQGKDGDFSQESKRMEDVYSGAYCVLAASCATDQRSGFLLPRVARASVALNHRDRVDNGDTIYVCSFIEDFRSHVLQGALHKRAWVLQEHALARRTVFFTEYQMYWECGYGVRCETMIKMTNRLAALLGDPDFPKILDPAKHGERIIRFQELYQQYSRLELSSDYDRPTAIDGLQQRLIRTMGVKGGFGVLDDGSNQGFLRRSLLWRRGEDTHHLKRIAFPNDREHVPSWSWMSVSGGIDYLHLPWQGYDWQDIRSPSWRTSLVSVFSKAFIGKSQAFKCPRGRKHGCDIVFDDPKDCELPELMAIVLGIEKGSLATEEKTHYILVVRPKKTSSQDGITLYERVGAGYMPGEYLEGLPQACALI